MKEWVKENVKRKGADSILWGRWEVNEEWEECEECEDRGNEQNTPRKKRVRKTETHRHLKNSCGN